MPANPIGVLLRNRRAGQDTLAWADPGLDAPETFALTSPAFEPGSPIPALHRGRVLGPNVSPPLEWTAPPPGTHELILLVQDPDVPFGKPATHAAVRGIDPSLGALPVNGLAHPSSVAGLVSGKGPFGRLGYAGPMPIPSHGPHHYVFQLFALDMARPLPASFTLRDAVTAMRGHVLGRARLDGTYENR